MEDTWTDLRCAWNLNPNPKNHLPGGCICYLLHTGISTKCNVQDHFRLLGDCPLPCSRDISSCICIITKTICASAPSCTIYRNAKFFFIRLVSFPASEANPWLQGESTCSEPFEMAMLAWELKDVVPEDFIEAGGRPLFLRLSERSIYTRYMYIYIYIYTSSSRASRGRKFAYRMRAR